MSDSRPHTSELTSRNNRKVVLGLCAVALAMLSLGFASKPLYDTFCRVTGYGGTTRVAEQISDTVLERTVKVRFDANVASNLDWSFTPDAASVDVRLGQNALAYYSAKNDTDIAIVGTASYNVSPIKAAPYFSKIECFCFTEQKLEAGESVSMPILFFVDPEMQNDPRLNEIETITLSYTFHKINSPHDGPVDTAARQAQLKKLKALELTPMQPETTENNTVTEKGRG